MRQITLILGLVLSITLSAQPYRSEVWMADQGNGTYKNPILHADYSDPDVIRVGDDYYMTASSFNCVPGLPILQSKDLVNWEIINYALDNLNYEGVEPADFFDRAQHGKGVWAPCLRYHNGEYMIYWGDPDFGIYVVKTKNIKGKWDEPILVLPGKGRIDPSPLFDEDGKVYLTHAWAGSRAHLNSVMTICELNAEGTKVVSEESLIYDGLADGNHTVEGGKFYKKDGYYYLLAPAGGVEMGWQIALRSKNVYGPYEMKKVLAQGNTEINGPHQGGLVETQTGEWWFIHFQDKGPYGRITHLQPVFWKDGWPVIGINDKDYCGEPVLTYRKPNVGKRYTQKTVQESDEFNLPKLNFQWSWHANPQQTWGFASSNGYYRMYGQYYPEDYMNFWDIPSLLLQKLPAPEFTATMKITAVLHNEGDKCGLIMMGWDYAYIALEKTTTGYVVELQKCIDAEQENKEEEIERIKLDNLNTDIKYNYLTRLENLEFYFRVQVRNGGMCNFSYSKDGVKFMPIGETFQARQGKWIGAKTGMFILNKTLNTQRSWMDVDWFRFTRL